MAKLSQTLALSMLLLAMVSLQTLPFLAEAIRPYFWHPFYWPGYPGFRAPAAGQSSSPSSQYGQGQNNHRIPTIIFPVPVSVPATQISPAVPAVPATPATSSGSNPVSTSSPDVSGYPTPANPISSPSPVVVTPIIPVSPRPQIPSPNTPATSGSSPVSTSSPAAVPSYPVTPATPISSASPVVATPNIIPVSPTPQIPLPNNPANSGSSPTVVVYTNSCDNCNSGAITTPIAPAFQGSPAITIPTPVSSTNPGSGNAPAFSGSSPVIAGPAPVFQAPIVPVSITPAAPAFGYNSTSPIVSGSSPAVSGGQSSPASSGSYAASTSTSSPSSPYPY